MKTEIEITKQLEKEFPNTNVYFWDKKVPPSIHTKDIVIDGKNVRIRHFSPFTEGRKPCLFWNYISKTDNVHQLVIT